MTDEEGRALARRLGLIYLDLDTVAISPAIIRLVPEAVARENVILPLATTDRELTLVVSAPEHVDLGKLRFVLNRQIKIVMRPE